MNAPSPELTGALELGLRNLLVWSVQLGLIAWAAAVATRVLPIDRPGPRLALWQGLLVLGLVLPALQPWRSAIAGVDWTLGLASTRLASPGAAGSSAQSATPAMWAPLVASLLLLVASGLLGRLVLGLARLRAIRRNAEPFETPAWLDEVRRRTAPAARFITSNACHGPATFGALRPLIVLPPAFASMPRDRQRAVALHELIHARRGDWPVLVAEEALKAILFFHPAVHWIVGRARLAREQCVDAEVVQSLGGRRAYLESLVEVARLVGRAEAVPAAPFLRERHLRERVELLLKEASMSLVRTHLHVGATAGALVLAGALAVAAFPMHGSPLPGTDPGATPAAQSPPANAKPFPTKIVHKVNPTYPKGAKEEGVQGIFLLSVTIDTKGHISGAEVVVSTPAIDYDGDLLSQKDTPGALAGDERLAQAAIEAVRQWRYEPVLDEDGKPTTVDAILTVKFVLS